MAFQYLWRLAILMVVVAQISAVGRAAEAADAAGAVVSGRVPLQASGGDGVVVGNVEHGAYLAQHVAMCVECHSGRDHEGTIIDSERFMGGQIPLGPPWTRDWASRAPRNRGLPGYTDEEGIRLLTHGAIDRQGRQLKLPMPRFRMTPQDAADIVAFLKSLP